MAAADQAKFKEDVHVLLRAGAAELIPTWLEKVLAEGSVEDMRKAVDLIVKTTGAEAEKKQDANAGLPVFNFVFHSATGTIQVAQEAPAPALKHEEPLTLDLEEVQAPEPVKAPRRGKAVKALPEVDVAPEPEPVQELKIEALPLSALDELDRELGLC